MTPKAMTPKAMTPKAMTDVSLREALEERYLTYALSTIMHRALPDVRDGLKPVHRRLLYAMRRLNLGSGSGFKKSARVVGDVIGRYHPHGDQAVYDTLARLAQDFSMRYPLVDGQGNFGSIDGDNAAAMRYTEARLTGVANALLAGIDEDAVDFRGTYDGGEREPVVLPAGFPNLLANGSAGIAVGMATSIPPHNVSELCAAALHLIAHPGARVAKISELVPGPDFPTGGILVESPESIAEAYKTGRGGFRLRARWHREDVGRGGYVIVVSEIPWQVRKSALLEKIAGSMAAGRIPDLADMRDESGEEVRVVFEPRSRSVSAERLMETLFRHSDLEVRIPLNMNVLSAGQVPGVVSLKEALVAWLDHCRDVLLRRTKHRLRRIEDRLEVLSGYLTVYGALDRVIRIIREHDDPGPRLMKALKLTERQATAILEMRLRALRKLEEKTLRAEHKALSEEGRELRKLIKSKSDQWKRVAESIKEVKKSFGDKRRTDFAEPPAESEMVEEAVASPITVVCSRQGWIRALKDHVPPDSDVRFKEGDESRFQFHAQTTDILAVFASNGRLYGLPADRLPGGRGHGQPIRLLLDIGDAEIVALFVYREGARYLMASRRGYGFVAAGEGLAAVRRAGRGVLNLADGDQAAACVEADGDSVAVVGENRKMLIFPLDQLKEMSRGRGVRLQRYRDGNLAAVFVFHRKEGLTVADRAGRNRTFTDLKPWHGVRSQAGRIVPKGFPR